MILKEKCIENKVNPRTIDDLQKESYERLSLVAETTNDIDLTEEKALFTTQFKSKCRNRGKMGHRQILRLDLSNSQGLRLN
jgi:hypothetical protein